MLISVNQEYVFDDVVIPQHAEIAIFAPVSGAKMSFPKICSITENEIEISGLLEQITLTSSSAATIFIIMVRCVTSGENPHETEHPEYEPYLS